MWFYSISAVLLRVRDVGQGRYLETLLIDEGFGSLDQEVLDRAVEALSDLKDPGSLVGADLTFRKLKQRILTQLEVEQTQEGSPFSMVTGAASNTALPPKRGSHIETEPAPLAWQRGNLKAPDSFLRTVWPYPFPNPFLISSKVFSMMRSSMPL